MLVVLYLIFLLTINSLYHKKKINYGDLDSFSNGRLAGIPNSSFLQIAILGHQVNSGCTQPIKSIINVVVSCRITSDAARLFIYSIKKIYLLRLIGILWSLSMDPCSWAHV